MTVPARSSVFVVGRDYSFDPSSVVVEGAGPLRIALRNEGSLAHNLKVLQGGRELGGTPTFQAGRTRSGLVDLRRRDYEMVCTYGNHEELGMVGTLEVR